MQNGFEYALTVPIIIESLKKYQNAVSIMQGECLVFKNVILKQFSNEHSSDIGLSPNNKFTKY